MDRPQNKYALPAHTCLRGGEYCIERTLGGGGFGITYLATWIQMQKTGLKTVKTGEKTVAIKELFYRDYCSREKGKPAICVSEDHQREFERLKRKFINEAKILNTFEHPHIVDVYDVFEENNTAYIVMAYIDGSDLERMIEHTGRFPVSQSLSYSIQVTEALDAIHEKNILHLDISPGNILVDKHQCARLIDFGISLSYDDDGKVRFTSSKLLTGKKQGFSPPEQHYQDNLGQIRFPIDIYALGATLYYCLTGVTPSDAFVMLEDGLKLPSSYNAEVIPLLDQVVAKAMSLKSSERYQTAKEFRQALRKVEEEYVMLQKRQEQERRRLEKLSEKETVLMNVPYQKQTIPPATKKSRRYTPVIISFFIISVLSFSFWQIQRSTSSSQPDILPDTAVVRTVPSENKPQAVTPDSIDNTKGHVKKENLKPVEQPDMTWLTEYNRIIQQADTYASTYSNQYNLPRAITEYKKALSLIPATDSSNKKNWVTTQISECNQQIPIQANAYLKQANIAFDARKLPEALALYKKVKVLDPSDDTGYNKFLNLARQLIGNTGYDKVVKDLLLNAKELKHTETVDALLSNCK